MCAIFGVFYDSLLESVSPRFESSLSLIRHRGPDGLRVIKNERCWMAQSLLSITRFPPLQDQPRFLRSGKVCFSFNGEIYNYKVLKDKHRLPVPLDFNDTDVFCALLERFDLEKTIDLIDGVYAFALYDLEKRELILGRDPLGEKPLYFRNDRGIFWYSSELIGVANDSYPRLSINLEFFRSFLALGFTSKNAFETLDVCEIKPGSIVRFWFYREDVQQKEICCKKIRGSEGNIQDSDGKFLEDLISAVDEMTDCPVRGAISLSSGIDSSLIAAALGSLGKNLMAFHFDTVVGEESRAASQIAKACNLDFVTISYSESMIDDFFCQLGDTCLPIFDPSALYFSEICKAAAEQGCRYIFTGDGGDELFNGYKRHRLQKYQRFLRLIPDSIIESLLSRKFGQDLNFFYRALFEAISAEKRAWPPVCSKSFVGMPKVISNSGETLDISRWDFENFLPYNGFIKSERIAMRNGLEVRMPLLRSSLCSFSPRAGGKGQGLDKIHLRGVLSQINKVAEQEVSREKKGFDPSHQLIQSLSSRIPVTFTEKVQEGLISLNSGVRPSDLSASLKIKLYVFERWCEIHNFGLLSR